MTTPPPDETPTAAEPVAEAGVQAAKATGAEAGRDLRRVRGGRLLAGLWLTLGLAGLALAGSIAWAWHSEAGTRALLNRLPGLSVTGWQGALSADTLSAERVVWQGGGHRLIVDGLRLQGWQWAWRPAPGAWLGIGIADASALQVRWQSAPSTTPAVAPRDLSGPLALQVRMLRIDHLQVDDLPPATDLQARLALEAGSDGRHQLDLMQMKVETFRIAGRLGLQAAAPLQLQGQIELDSQATDWPWQARLVVDGRLADLGLQGSLQGTARAGLAAPSATLSTRLQPFAAWPLGDLVLKAEALDLAAFSTSAPSTRLQIDATLHTAGLAQAAEARIRIRNEGAGPWNEQRLPLRQLELTATGTPQPLREIRLEQLQIDWGPAQRPAGSWTGSGQVGFDDRGNRVELTLKLNDWLPGELDRRLPALRLNGPLTALLTGARTASGSDAGSASPAGPATPPQLALKASLTGQLSDPGTRASLKLPPTGTPLSIGLELRADPQRIELQELSLRADPANARLSGQIERGPDALWRWKLAGSVAQLDPRHWWPGAPGSAWQTQASLLNATLESQASLPSGAWGSLDQVWHALRGQTSLRLGPSQWAGVPVEGQLLMSAEADQQRAEVELHADDALLQGRWQPDGARISLTAPRLQALAGWLRLSPATAPWLASSGSLQLQASAEPDANTGPWRWRGQAEVQGLATRDLQLGRARLWANGGTQPDALLNIALAADNLQTAGARLQQLAGSVTGSLAEHRLALQFDSPVQPPLWLERLTGSGPGRATRFVMGGAGRWGSPAEGHHWQLQLDSLRLGSRDGPGTAWLAAAGQTADLQWTPDGQLQTAQLAPGRIELPGTRLEWTEARFQGAEGGRPAVLSVMATIPPTAIAPILDPMQPDTAWRGDLRLGGSLRIRHAGTLEAELKLERLSGDLTVDEDGLLGSARRQALGLTELGLNLQVRQGQWHWQQVLAGQHLGRLASELSVNTDAALWWPASRAPMQGSVEARVANIGAWAPWVPAGWRVAGQLEGAAQVSGQWGAPELSGKLTGEHLGLRNALQGVDLNEGQLALTLDGAQATLQTLSFKGGAGSLILQGTAALGADPKTRLTLVADRFRVFNRIDRQLVASGQASLVLDKDSLNVTGALGIDEGLFDISQGDGPTLPDDVVIAEPKGAPAADTVAASRAPRRVNQLALQVDLGKKLRVRGLGIDTRLQGSLKLGSPRGKLSAQGTLNTVDGTYAAYGQKLTIERGQMLFTGPLDDPRLDIYAVRPNLDVEVGVTITGTALNPRVRLASGTDMSDTDKLSWLVMGRAPEGLGQADTALLQRAAMALLAGGGESPTDKFLSNLGLSDFSLRQASDGTVQTTVVSVGKQLTRRWYVGYERSVNATAGTWQLIYRIAQRFTLRAQSGEDSALDLIWTWRWE